ncbi:hypothetical protein DB347_03375 [Opitutaceae bacterium EW11]|nr:hypothetical protein DB347_03375 [Opitutaceae bacterium EW11]
MTAQVSSTAADNATVEGTVSVAAGGAILSGHPGAYQQQFQSRMNGFGGIDELRYKRETKTATFQLDGRFLPGDADYLLHLRLSGQEKWYVDAGYKNTRVWYDGLGGYFAPTNTSFHLFDESLYVDRSDAWVELGWVAEDTPYLKIRYDHETRDGSKGSTMWGDTNLVGRYGTRSVVPSIQNIDEKRDIVTVDAGKETEQQTWQVGVRYDHSSLNNGRMATRRPLENVSRAVTQKDDTSTDLFSAHAFTERRFTEQLTMSTGGSITTLDTNLDGSRIYGAGYDPVFDPAYAHRQARDEGFYDLSGGSEVKQYVFNFNIVYLPAKNWSIRPSFRFEDMTQNNSATFVETNIASNLSAQLEDLASQSHKRWDEFTEAVDVRYTGLANVTFNWRAELVQGTGNLSELEEAEETGIASLYRKTDISRDTQKYSFTSNWYARPGLTFAAQYYYKARNNDYTNLRDSTPATGGDRYPGYIDSQDFATNDFNLRVSWRPTTKVSLVTRYDYQRSNVDTAVLLLQSVESGKLTSHIISENVTWNPINRLYIVGNVNVVYDSLATPAAAYVRNSDNNYLNASLGGGYALGKITDVYFDYSFYRANDFTNNASQTLPYGADQKRNVASLTWVRRQSERLLYTVKYSYVSYDDRTSGNRADFNAHVLYGKVQYRF